MRLPTLYSRAATGAVQEWTITFSGDSYYTEAGQVGGVITKSVPTICKPKNIGKANETTASEQAESEARAKWKKKIESKYFEDIKDIDGGVAFKPMLAHSWDDHKEKVVFPVYSQPKLDGIRCNISVRGAFSRNDKPFATVAHIQKALAPIIAEYPGIVFDGELYNHLYHDDFNTIASLVKKQKPSDEELAVISKKVQYWVYDIDLGDGKTFGERLKAMVSIFNALHDPAVYNVPSYIVKFVRTHGCKTQKELDDLYGEYLKDNFEGQMVRLNEPYQHKRTSFLLKRKEFITEEFEIIDVIEGDGNKSGMAGAVTCLTKEGKQFNSNIKANFDWLKGLLKNKGEAIGKMGTVRYFNLTPDKIPRFPYLLTIRDYE